MPNWKKVIVSGSNASLNSITVSSGATVTGSLTVTGSSIIYGPLVVGSGSAGSGENTLVVGVAPNGGVGEGGQILLSAVGGTYTSASMLDNYQNTFRVLNGTNAGSNRMDLELSHITQNLRIFGDVIAYAASDKRLKNNIQPINNALDTLTNIGGYTFDWDETLKDTHGHEGKDIGVIAQEIEKVLPEVVTTRESGYKAVKYEKIVPLLIEAIKELKAEVDRLKSGNYNNWD